MSATAKEVASMIAESTSVTADEVAVWSPRPALAPQCSVDKIVRRSSLASLRVASRGMPECYGGWEVRFGDVHPGKTYLATTYCKAQGIVDLIDHAPLLLFWRDGDGAMLDYDYVLPGRAEDGWVEFAAKSMPPEGAVTGVLQCAIRWSRQGALWWADFSLVEADPPPNRQIRVCCATAKPVASRSVEDNVEHFCRLLDEAAKEKPDLVCLPECVTSWGVADGTSIDCARPIPGPETDAFGAKAKEHGFVLGLSMCEQIGEFVYNSGVLFGRNGGIVGKYHKVHLAVGEGWQGVSPGNEWPVFDTACGRIGMNICKDSSIPESARCLAQKGMQILLMPIMGDHRAQHWTRTKTRTTFDPDRWKIIQRCRAMDNHVYMVICRNVGEGSCIIAPDGTILAHNDGDIDVIAADIEVDAQWRCWRGATFRDSVWAERRPHLYDGLACQS